MSDTNTQTPTQAEPVTELNLDTDVSELDLDLSGYTGGSDEANQESSKGAPSIEDTLVALGKPVAVEQQAVAEEEPQQEQAPAQTESESKSEEASEDDRLYNLRREYERKFDNLRSEFSEKDATIERLFKMVTDRMPEKKAEVERDPLVERLQELTDQDTDPDQAIEAANIRAQLADKRTARLEKRLEELVGGMEQQRQQSLAETQRQQYMTWASDVLTDAVEKAVKGTGVETNNEVKAKVFQLASSRWQDSGYSQEFANQYLQDVVAAEAKFFVGLHAKPKDAPNEIKKAAMPPPAVASAVIRSRGNPASAAQGKRKSILDMSDEEFVDFTASHIAFD